MKTDDGYDLDNINIITNINQHNFEVGKYYKTRGGWKAICVWICQSDIQDSIYFVHRPGEKNIESVPIIHNPLGIALSSFSVNDPPHYGIHPADIIGEWIE